jgi:SAM-dependent methyltransferase
MFVAGDHNPVGRFDALADQYARYRPEYPRACLDMLLRGEPPGALIIDVGCGTGILTRALAERGYRVIGIEPNETMRTVAERTPCSAAITPSYFEGRAEATGVETAAAAMVVAAQAFHWFDPEMSLREFHRMLVPGGRLALLWNIYDQSDPLSASYWSVLREFATDPAVVEQPHDVAGRVLLSHPLFQDAVELHFPNSQLVDEAGFLGRAFSSSFSPKEEGTKAACSEKLRLLFQEYACDGLAALTYKTIVFSARKRTRLGH